MSSDEKPNGDTMENEQKDEEMKSNAAAEDGKEDAEQKDEKDGDGDKEGEEEEEEEESSSDEELPLGSVEAPVQIMTGKRDRKKVERLVMKETPKTPEKKFVLPVGKGVKIGDIPIVAHFLEKTKSQDLKPLHKFLFGKMVRDPRENKRNIRQFSGFEFSKDDSDYTKREALLVKFTMEGIKEICTILDVEKKGNKDVIMERIMEFCLNPQPSGRTLPEKGKKKSKSKGTKKKTKTKTKAKKQKGEGKKGGGDASTETEEDGDTTMDEGTEGDAEGEDGDTSMTEGESKPKKKKPKTTTPKPKKESAKTKTKSPKKKKIAVKTPSKQTKKSSPVKSPKKTPQKRNHDVVDDDSSDEEPLMKKIKAPPSDKQIKETIKEILEGANLEEVTMKMVCRKVYDIYPQHPLTHKKDFIKSTVREIIS